MTERDNESPGLRDGVTEAAAESTDEGRLPGEGVNPAGSSAGVDTGGQVGTTIREPAAAGENVGTTIRVTAPTVEEVGTTVRDVGQTVEESGTTVRVPFPDEP